jgi:hypothetical protein
MWCFTITSSFRGAQQGCFFGAATSSCAPRTARPAEASDARDCSTRALPRLAVMVEGCRDELESRQVPMRITPTFHRRFTACRVAESNPKILRLWRSVHPWRVTQNRPPQPPSQCRRGVAARRSRPRRGTYRRTPRSARPSPRAHPPIQSGSVRVKGAEGARLAGFAALGRDFAIRARDPLRAPKGVRSLRLESVR